MIQGFNQEGQRAVGIIRIQLTMEDMVSSALFHVVDAKTSYNMLLGRPWFHQNAVVPSTWHQCFKYCRNGIVKRYDPKEKLSLGKLSPEATGKKLHGLNATQIMLKEKGHAIQDSRVDGEVAEEDAKDAPAELEEGHEALSFMDGSSGYNQIRMAPAYEELTAFRTPKSIYCCKFMPFGLKNAGATYQRTMQKIFDDMLHKNVECYVDDLVVKLKKRENHFHDMRKVFKRLRRYQLKMNPSKCAFGVTSRKFLGFIVHQQDIEIEQAKIDAILRLPKPRNIYELKSLQGKLAYLRRFISNLASHCQRFSRLMKKGERSVGILLAQKNDEGNENALYYLSRMMTPNELRYSPVENLCLALIFSIQKLKHYFQSHSIHLVSKANPLKYVTAKQVLSDRLVRWYLQLQQFKITYVPQKAVKGQVLADFLADHPMLPNGSYPMTCLMKMSS
ncbi:UNVERIFIED_CONTAM: Retrovirus-related Pol polyprotein from transposon.6 [Sesamum calycinum]|uniref:Retrovirus-related Pol polyprotein from transposon.6 n=1 Tax=Sesamum calycinum TaxID=2727403 RepID=A0AAW2P9M8_9LAMI